MESGVFSSVSSLQALNLAHNRISNLSQTLFNGLRHLKTLRLDNNRLEDINGLLTAQGELQWLNLSANSLQWFDYAFVPKSVRWLDIHENRLESLSNYYELRDNFSLQTIDASDNLISSLGPLSFPDSVRYVYVNRNRISEVLPKTFEEKHLLSRVEMTENAIEKLAMASLAVGERGKTLSPIFIERLQWPQLHDGHTIPSPSAECTFHRPNIAECAFVRVLAKSGRTFDCRNRFSQPPTYRTLITRIFSSPQSVFCLQIRSVAADR